MSCTVSRSQRCRVMLPLVPSYRHYDLVAMIRMLTRTRCVCILNIFYRDMMHLIDSDACVLDCDKPTHTNMRLYVVNRSMCSMFVVIQKHSMTAIIRGQRDRFRKRMLELEQEKEQHQKKVQVAQAGAQQLRRDNVKLYEKIKYLQSYHRGRNQGGGNESDTRIHVREGASPSGAPGGADEEKYRDQYEDGVNPFTLFNRRERFVGSVVRYLSVRSVRTRVTCVISSKVQYGESCPSAVIVRYPLLCLLCLMADCLSPSHSLIPTLVSPSHI